MKSILAAIRAVLARLAAGTTRWVRKGGHWVLEHIPAFTAAPAPMPMVEPVASAAPDDVAPIRRVAGVLAQGKPPQPADLAGIADRHLAWLRQLDRLELCRVLAAKDEQIRAHVKGIAPIRSVPQADAETVSQLKASREARRQEAMAARSARERREEVERQIIQMETGSPIPAM